MYTSPVFGSRALRLNKITEIEEIFILAFGFDTILHIHTHYMVLKQNCSGNAIEAFRDHGNDSHYLHFSDLAQVL